MAHQFDELAKVLAEGVSRRDALRRLGGTFAGTLFASLGMRTAWGHDGLLSQCQQLCQQLGFSQYHPDQNPGKVSFNHCVLCCTTYGLDAPCVSGHTFTCCTGSRSCQSGTCVDVGGGQACPFHPCPTDQTCCNTAYGKQCVDLKTDEKHCGMCNHPCSWGKVCKDGTCVSNQLCPDNREPCGWDCCPSHKVCSPYKACVCPPDTTTCGFDCCKSDEKCVWKWFWYKWVRVCVRVY